MSDDAGALVRELFAVAGLVRDCSAGAETDLTYVCALIVSGIQANRLHLMEAVSQLRGMLRDPHSMEQMVIGRGAMSPFGTSGPCLTLSVLGQRRWDRVCEIAQQLKRLGTLRVKSGGVNTPPTWSGLDADTSLVRAEIAAMVELAMIRTARAHPRQAAAQVQMLLPVFRRSTDAPCCSLCG